MQTFDDDLHDDESLGGCDSMSALLQPFIDDELDASDHESMAQHLGDCDVCRGEVQRQHAVRAAMQQLEYEAVPPHLLAKIREELDRVDLEHEGGVVSIDRPPVSRARAFARGVGMMLPAAAAAVALFFVVRSNPANDTAEAARIVSAAGVQEGADEASASGAEIDAAATAPAAAPAATPIARQALPDGIELVGGDSDAAQRVHRFADRRSGAEFQRLAEPASQRAPSGTRQMFRGQAYFLSRDAQGRPQVQVRRGDTVYTFVEVNSPGMPGSALDIDAPSFQRLVVFSESLHGAH